MSNKERTSSLDGEKNKEDDIGSTSRSPLVEFQQIPGNVDNKEEATSFKAKDHLKQEGNTKTSLPFYKLFSFADSTDILLMVLGTVGAIGNGICIPLISVLLANSISAFGENANSKEQVVHAVAKVCLDFLYLAIGSGLAGFLEVTCWIITGERQATRIRSLYLKTILRQDIGFFDTETTSGEIIERMSSDTLLIQDAMGEKVGRCIQLATTFIGSFVIAFIKGWLLTLVLSTSMPAIIISGSVMSTLISKLASKGQTAYSLAATVVEQTIGSIRTVASFTGEKRAISKYNKSLIKAYKSGVKEGLAAGLGFGTAEFVLYGSYGLGIWYGGKLILEKGYLAGEVLNVLFAVTNGALSLGQASPCIRAFATGQAAAYKLFEAIERKPHIDAYDSKGVKLEDIRGDIELRDVFFSYPSRPFEPIFNGFSILIPSGITAAMVGQSGSGKSTVISLIERFYDPQVGEVLIDGINLKEFQLKWIREKIGLVSQEPVLFTCSIKDNIAYGKQGVTIKEIRAALELANAAKFVDKLPQGLDTMVGEHGTQLSGGQRQRVAIARAILKDPRILLLDEATSALDAKSERIVQEALDKIMINRTTVIVAHRLSTVKNADMIAVIHQGKIIEKGTHYELTRDPDGAYSQLIKMQEMSKSEEKSAETHQGKSEITLDIRPSCKVSSPLRYIGWESPGIGNISPYSFHDTVNVPIGTRVVEAAPVEPHTSASKPKKPAPSVPLHRLAYINKPEIPVLLLGTVAAGVVGITLPFLGIILSGVIKSLFEPPHELRKGSNFWALMYLCLATTCLLGHSFKSYFFAVAGCKLIRRIRTMCFEKVVYMEISWFDEPENSTGALASRLSTDASSVRCMVGDALGLLVQNMAALIVALLIAFGTNWQLALIVLALLPFIGFQGFVLVKFLDGFGADSKKLYEEASQVANDAVGSIRTIASFCAEEKVMELYNKKCEGPLKLGTKQGLIGGGAFGLSFFFSFAVFSVVFYAGARFVETGRTRFSDVFRVLYALSYSAMGICQSGFLSPNATKSRSAVASIFALLHQKSKTNSGDESGETIQNLKGEIEFQQVHFKYPTRPDVQIFKNICLTIQSGKTVALVGESGSGKSTVISLLLRFYDPDLGCITLDGIEIQKLKLKWLRQQMGLVSQEPILFNDTIRANIAYGKEGNSTEAEIIAATKLANAHNFISGLKQGYDTMVGERGAQLSGGQKQRVAIARAIIKSPKILLLDEATSALDTESERIVQNALDQVMVGRTTVVVAHRLSTIKNADIIAVVKNGVIVEKGNHETLVNIRGGFYASLVALQTSASS